MYDEGSEGMNNDEISGFFSIDWTLGYNVYLREYNKRFFTFPVFGAAYLQYFIRNISYSIVFF